MTPTDEDLLALANWFALTPDIPQFPNGWTTRDAAAALRAIVAERREIEVGETPVHLPQADLLSASERQEIRDRALEDAAQCCADEADRCDDAVKWGGHRRYIQDCKAAAYAMRNRANAIRAMKGTRA